ncbi:MAG: hypothetical protein JW910_01280 [Anaerolineae bacterium]|nr:hypothetical protein [Anaerolineae bacterium]
MPAHDETVQPFLGALRQLAEGLAASGVLWAVTGSLGMVLQGVPLKPHDVDVQTDAAGAYEIARRFAPNVVSPVCFSAAERIRSHFGALELDGVPVEIMGDVEKRQPGEEAWEAVDLARHVRHVTVAGVGTIPVLELPYEVEAYRKLGRFERADLVQHWLDTRQAGG